MIFWFSLSFFSFGPGSAFFIALRSLTSLSSAFSTSSETLASESFPVRACLRISVAFLLS